MSRPETEHRTPEPRPEGIVVVWQQEDGSWRWRWAPGPDSEPTAAIWSHRAFDSLEQARASAGEAFPDSPVLGPDGPEPPVVVPRRRVRALLVAALGAAVLVAVHRARRGR